MYKTEVCVHRRENNKKRNYVLVNKNQCKHVPVDGFKMRREMNFLVYDYINKCREFLDLKDNFIVIGFAETATALGAMFSFILNDTFENVYYTHTTRERLDTEFIEFKEEHSHAVEQKLCTDLFKRLADKKYHIIFVEDEVTTGKTILNTVRNLKENGITEKSLSITVASILNGMNEEQMKNFDANGINYVYLNKLEAASVYTEQANNLVCNDNYYDLSDMSDECEQLEDNLYTIETSANTMRKGDLIHRYFEKDDVDSLADIIVNAYGRDKLHKVVVVGTEEFMSYPVLLSYYLGYMLNCKVNINCHSTTRSPIETSDNTFLKDRVKLTDNIYENGRVTYLYNTMSDDTDADLVMFVTDGSNLKALNRLANHYIKRAGAKEVVLVQFKFECRDDEKVEETEVDE